MTAIRAHCLPVQAKHRKRDRRSLRPRFFAPGGGLSLLPFSPVPDIVETVRMPPPVSAPHGALHLCIGPRRQADDQAHRSARRTAQRQQVNSRTESAEEHFPAAKKHMRAPVCAAAGIEHHAVHGPEILHKQPDSAAPVLCRKAQRGLRLLTVRQAEAAAGPQAAIVCSYRSSLALTTYSPSTTPPKRYLPASFVLVVATSSSFLPLRSVTT